MINFQPVPFTTFVIIISFLAISRIMGSRYNRKRFKELGSKIADSNEIIFIKTLEKIDLRTECNDLKIKLARSSDLNELYIGFLKDLQYRYDTLSTCFSKVDNIEQVLAFSQTYSLNELETQALNRCILHAELMSESQNLPIQIDNSF